MSAALEQLRFLLVDDNHHMRAIVSTILKGVGVRHVHEAMDGAEALQVVRDRQVDIAIVDFKMSPLDGVQFTQLVRKSPDSADPFLPIIMLTGFAERHRVFEARDAGVTEIVVKPVTARSLLDRINTVIFKPRPFIRTGDYFGPCRRRRDDPHYKGPHRRASERTLEL
ncbi:two-component system response regulator [Caulobacter sp. Root655]|jgi:CheY-like chemotaxis protein|uniref:response regulator n=1 Tax=Caulobacter sp. Root655 TaxID=1736578 RepID=UPI0006F9A9AD|nr:response regulator [Caulobacter sp. Root655]KRA59460.1 two-component system response regulator [Caulobacter sp. Root655]